MLGARDKQRQRQRQELAGENCCRTHTEALLLKGLSMQTDPGTQQQDLEVSESHNKLNCAHAHAAAVPSINIRNSTSEKLSSKNLSKRSMGGHHRPVHLPNLGVETCSFK